MPAANETCASLPPRRSIYAKPVIGIAGGIGSGKTFVAQAFVPLGCVVINSDAVAHEVLKEFAVVKQLVEWWGEGVLSADGSVNRKALAGKIFGNPGEVAKLNGLIHPRVRELRDLQMKQLMTDGQATGIVWDTPLLYETGMDRECDAAIFVKVPYDIRLERVMRTRGWHTEELMKRENLQFSLDKKELLADYYVDNSGEASATLRQVREIFSQILARKALPA